VWRASLLALAVLAGCSVSRAGTATSRVGRDGEIARPDACVGCGLDAAPGPDAPADVPLVPPDTGLPDPPDAGCFAAGGACMPGTTRHEEMSCGACGEGRMTRDQVCGPDCIWAGEWTGCAGVGCTPGERVDMGIDWCEDECGRFVYSICTASCTWMADAGPPCSDNDCPSTFGDACAGTFLIGYGECCDDGDWRAPGTCPPP
jgi:hypothetical protein